MWHSACKHSVIFTKLKGDVTSIVNLSSLVYVCMYMYNVLYYVYPSWPNQDTSICNCYFSASVHLNLFDPLRISVAGLQCALHCLSCSELHR